MTLAWFLLLAPPLLPGRLARLTCLAPVLLASCGDLPQPFLGNPGATGRILAQPPTPRLAVPVPPQALLPDQSAESFAQALSVALQNQEVPAVEGPAQPGDWHLAVTAGLHGATVVPVYTVVDPNGRDRGKTEGKPLASADWSAATPVTLARAAIDAAPGIADMLTGIQHADPNSLYNRPAKVQVLDVTGAPGDGNLALTRQMRTLLTRLGPVVQPTADGADFIVRGTVKLVPIAGDQQRVEIQWSVAAPGGDERGRVVQLNNVPAGSLNGYWGDVAIAVAQEAAGGVRDVILRQSGHEPGNQAAGQAANQAAAQSTARPATGPATGAPAGPATAPPSEPPAGPATHAAPHVSSPPGAPASP
jgi:hypothetical protein